MSIALFSPTIPHFFQPLLPGFHLSIPLSFFKDYLKGQINCESAVLRSYGRTWSVKIRDRRFEDGWQDFARDHDLHVGDFLVFRYGGNMVFDVVVFDTSACQRQYPLLATQTQQTAKEIGKQHEKRTSTSVTLESPHFVSNLTLESMKSFRLNIPRKFARSNDLDRSCETVLVDEQGRSWMASIRLKDSDGQVYIGRGWRNICIGNSLGLKDCVKLELIGNGITPIFKLYKVASNSDAKKLPNCFGSNAGCSGGSTIILE
ncbi:hypothetical protein ERO13_A07G034736v2 [Gossypium hirsutum]|uniref:TF-B3 domain-containing protein n=3 Tax=Gossypium TaxID=3633 RepID=A0A2P5XIR8_GOSBA|nr:B3 domain-containing protein REM5-like [Gossypium hirsutum]KAB2072775.1 hypothetical protein ES319_A07G039600v1 [Gossypium barbadense]KAG4190490.1 hypothetical protein ERO13_A07G034736v2 [Gossypium hirsutum]PPS03204.1 hypothetical protein GOBAR_AA17446 [Gossypium barbadense]TYJ25289.1 hypothetical protein E1A91_A07G039700v1 [Gossypium mustelinum]